MTQIPSPTGAPTVLVTAASKYGSTAEIAVRIGQVLAENGCVVTVMPPEEVGPISFDAVVLGSAVYMGRWRKEARKFAQRLEGEPARVWLFSSGPLGDPPHPIETPNDVPGILESTSGEEHVIFAGKADKSKLSFPDRAVLNAVHAPEGDFRDWDEITAWALRIAGSLSRDDSVLPS